MNTTKEKADKINEIAHSIIVCAQVAMWLTSYKNGEFQIDDEEMNDVATMYTISGLLKSIEHLSHHIPDYGEWIAEHGTDKTRTEEQQ